MARRLLVAVCMTAPNAPALGRYPHAAEILDVSGRWIGTQAELAWTTGVEYGTAGFRVYRQDAGASVPLHEGILPVDITQPTGRTYAVPDTTQKPGAVATYRIDELRGDGSTLTLGVWTVAFAKSAHSPAPAPAAAAIAVQALGEPLTTGPAAKVPVVANDIHAVSFSAIAAVLGLTVEDAAERARQSTLAMRCGDEPVAYRVDAAGARILFYGWPAVSTYTKTNIFWIEPGEGLQIPRIAPDAIAVASDLAFTRLRVYEEDLAIMTERGILRDDLYFWRSFVAGNATQGVRTFDVPLDGHAGGDVRLTVHLIGWNDTALDPDHQADVLLNGAFLGSVTFDGKGEVSATFVAPAATVLSGGNVLEVRAILRAGHVVSYFVLDRFEAAYARYYEPANGLLHASDGGHARLSADRFSAPWVFDVTDRHAPVWIADATGAIPSGQSWAAQAGTSWILREQAAVPDVTPEPGGFGAWLRATTNAIDYLVIAPRAFEATANALAEHRAGLGLRTAVALYEDVCDQFAGGLRSPESIRSMLAYAQQQWVAAPWMVVLCGWGHYDYLGATTAIPNPLPPLLASDSATLRPADGRFADLTGNGIPDLAIGRIPAQTVGQFEAYLDKLRDYESGGPRSWLQEMLFAADNADGGGDFTASNLEMAIPAAQRYATAFATLDSQALAEVKAQIKAAFTNGSGIVHYTGHGSYQQLAGENLLSVGDVNAMVNPPAPLFMSLTCLIGRFDMLATRSLAEALVLRSDGGSLAVYAPSGLSWNLYATPFGKAFYQGHAVDRGETLGLALLHARQSFGVLSGLHAAAIGTYNLLGDPAIKLQGGGGGEPPPWIVDLAPWRWERFSYADLANPANSLQALEALREARRATLLMIR